MGWTFYILITEIDPLIKTVDPKCRFEVAKRFTRSVEERTRKSKECVRSE